jgi:predicted MPP superfamily phosphohydrolase
MVKIKKKSSKRKTILTLCILCILVTLVSTYYYSRFIAPTAYQTTEKSFIANTLPTSIKNLKIGFISDINLKTPTDINRLEDIVKTINKEKYDMVIFGGDLYNDAPFNVSDVVRILKTINSSSGKFAVQGEKDVLHSNDVISILSDGGFEVLHNEYRKIYYQDTVFALFGLENNGDISGLVNTENEAMFKLVVVHEPDYFTQSKNQNIDLQLSGHSLGGYIHLPIYGPVFKRLNAETFVSGTYEREKSTLMVSNGLGLESGYQYRLFCPNEILSVSITGNKDT